MKKLDVRQVVSTSRLEISAGLGLIMAAGLLLFRLGSLPAQMSVNELNTFHADLSLHAILHNPLDAPYKLTDYLVLHVYAHSVALARLTSVGFALLAIVLFFVLILRWHGQRSAWLATALFATSGWLLHIGRLGTDNVVWLIVPLTLLLLASWLSSTEHTSLSILISATVLGAILFVPAGIWFIVAFVILQHKLLSEHLVESQRGQIIGAAAIILLCVGILTYSFVQTPELIRPWLGLPQPLPAVFDALRQWADSLAYLFARGPNAPELWLAHTPILDVFTAAMTILGIYFYATHFRNQRARMLAVFAFIGSVMVALNGPVAMSLVVPIAYLLAATGLTFLLREWLVVFPRNPLARAVGITLLSAAILATVAFHIIAYFIAWQHNPGTAVTFTKILL